MYAFLLKVNQINTYDKWERGSCIMNRVPRRLGRVIVCPLHPKVSVVLINDIMDTCLFGPFPTAEVQR